MTECSSDGMFCPNSPLVPLSSAIIMSAFSAQENPDSVAAENRFLREQRTCKICMDAEVSGIPTTDKTEEIYIRTVPYFRKQPHPYRDS